jgi:hypothetical protein
MLFRTLPVAPGCNNVSENEKTSGNRYCLSRNMGVLGKRILGEISCKKNNPRMFTSVFLSHPSPQISLMEAVVAETSARIWSSVMDSGGMRTTTSPSGRRMTPRLRTF